MYKESSMPVTFAHPAIILPIKKAFPSLSLPALFIGAMGPDLTYFIPLLDPSRNHTHSTLGIFTCSLPLVLLFVQLYTQLLKHPLFDSLPWQIEVKNEQSSLFNSIISALIGISSHLLWDSFTHYHTLVAETFPILRQSMFTFLGEPILLHKILQYASSAVGTFILLAVGLKSYRSKIPHNSKPEWNRLIPITSAFFTAITLAPLIVELPRQLTLSGIYPFLMPLLTALTTLFFASFVIYSYLFHYHQNHNSNVARLYY